jgi:hypothetical protein
LRVIGDRPSRGAGIDSVTAAAVEQPQASANVWEGYSAAFAMRWKFFCTWGESG